MRTDKITQFSPTVKKLVVSDLPTDAFDAWIFDNVWLHAVWNPDHECWDDPAKDDYWCDADRPTHYMTLPWANPKFSEEA